MAAFFFSCRNFVPTNTVVRHMYRSGVSLKPPCKWTEIPQGRRALVESPWKFQVKSQMNSAAIDVSGC